MAFWPVLHRKLILARRINNTNKLEQQCFLAKKKRQHEGKHAGKKSFKIYLTQLECIH